MTTGTDYSTVAGRARLRDIEAGTPGCRKIGRAQGFTCLSEHWKPVNDRIRKWIEDQGIPPARDEIILAGGP